MQQLQTVDAVVSVFYLSVHVCCFCVSVVSVFQMFLFLSWCVFSIVCQVFLNRVVVTVLADLQLCFIWFVFQSLRLLLVRAVTLWHRHFGTVGTDTLAQ